MLGELGPDVDPVIAEIAARDGAIGFPLDADTQLAAEFLIGAASLAHVAFRCAAPRGEIGACGLVEAVEIGDELVHTAILLDGNGKSIPFGVLPFGN